jgi:hypothetical protein
MGKRMRASVGRSGAAAAAADTPAAAAAPVSDDAAALEAWQRQRDEINAIAAIYAVRA